MNAPLYNADILRLAATIPHAGRLTDPQATSEKYSPVCGSRVTVDLALDDAGRVVRLGLVVNACALGQAAANLMASHAIGRDAAALAVARDALADWLAGERATPPDWPGMAVLAPARPHSARHASIRLAFEAAAEAAQQAARAR